MPGLNDVSEAFEEWLEPITIIRSAPGSYVGGLWVPVSTSVITIQAVVQNANPDDLKVLPEGLRSTESIKLHTETLVKTVDEAGEADADIVNYLGSEWKTYNVANRQIGSYYKLVAIKVKP